MSSSSTAMLDTLPSRFPIPRSPAAHRIPNEILDEVAWYFCPLYNGINRFRIRSLCLVSRRWSDIIRPELWEYVEITSAVHLHKLCDLLDIPSPPSLTPISYFIRLPSCAVSFLDRSQPPWLHLVHSQLASRLENVITTSLTVHHDGTLVHLPTLHPHLPRALPSCFAPVQVLRLYRMQFKNRAALLHLLSSLVHLNYLSCRELSWQSEELPLASLVLRSGVDTICIEDGSDAWEEPEVGMAVWWLLPAAFGARDRPNARTAESASTLRETDFRTITALVSALQSGRRLKGYVLQIHFAEVTTHSVYPPPLEPMITYLRLDSVEIRCAFATQDGSEVRVILNVTVARRSAADAATRFAEITRLSIDFCRHGVEYREGTWTLADWTAFTRKTREFEALEDLHLRFSSEQEARAFLREFGVAFEEVEELIRFEYISTDVDGRRETSAG